MRAAFPCTSGRKSCGRARGRRDCGSWNGRTSRQTSPARIAGCWSRGSASHLLREEMAALAVFDFDDPAVAVGLEAVTNQGVDAALVGWLQDFEVAGAVGIEGGAVEAGLAAGCGYFHEDVAAVCIALVDDHGEGAGCLSTAHKGGN